MPDESTMPPELAGLPQRIAAMQQNQGDASGVGGATMPVPNAGLHAKALAQLAIHVQGMQTILAVVPAGSDIANDLRSAINRVAKYVAPSNISPGMAMSEAQQTLQRQRMMAPQQMVQRATQPQPQPQPAMPMGG